MRWFNHIEKFPPKKGASLGNLVAKKEAVSLNPYAQLCNQMVKNGFFQFRSFVSLASSGSASHGSFFATQQHG